MNIKESVKNNSESIENELIASEEKYRNLINNLIDLVMEIDSEGTFQYVSPQVKMMLGYNPEEVIGKSGFEFIHPDDIEICIEAFSDLLKKEEVVNFEYRVKHKSGQYIDLNASAKVINKENDLKIIVVARDISEQKKVKKALKQSEKEWHTTFDSNQDAIWIINENNIILRSNKGAEKIFQKTNNELVGSYCCQIVHNNNDPIPGCPFQKVKKSLMREIEEMKIGEAWFQVTIDPIFDDNNQFNGAIHSIRDITERKLSEENLLQSKLLLESSIESPKDMIILALDLDYRYIYFNKTHANSMKQVYRTIPKVGGCIFDYIDNGDDIEKVKSQYKRAFNGESHIEIEEYGKYPSRYYYEIHYNPIISKNNEIIGVTSFAHNITERKQVEKALIESESLWKSLTEESPDHVATLDRDLRILYLNRPSPGLSMDELIGKPMYTFAKEKDQERVKSTLEEILKTGKQARYETEFPLDDGRIVYYESIATPRKLANGEVQGITITARDITHIKKAEEALAHSHELMNYVIEHINSAVAVHDKDLNYVYVSQNYLDQYNVKEQDVLGKHHYDVFPDLPQKWRDVHRKALAGEISSADDDPYEREDGTVDWTRWECRPWYEADGSVGGIIVYTEIITERKKAEERALNLAKFPAENPNPVLRINADGTLIFGNKSGLKLMKILGCEIDQSISANLKEYIDKSLEVNRPVIGEIKINKITYSMTFAPIKEMGYVNIYGLDISDRKNSEILLKESEQKFRDLFENAPVMIHSIDSEGIIISVNKKWLDKLGYSIDEVIGKKSIDFLTKESRKRAIETFIPDMMKKGFVQNASYQFVKKNGDIVDTHLTAYSDRDKNGILSQSIAVIIDVTEENIFKDKLIQERKRAEFYLDLLSHDVGNIHQGVLSWLQLAKLEKNENEMINNGIINSERLTKRSINLIKNVKILAQIRSKTLKTSSINIVETINSTIKTTANMFADMEIESHIRKTKRPLFISAEPIIESLFINIFHNGIKIQDSERPRIDIKLSSIRKNQFCKIEISDYGPGIKDDMKRIIFEREKMSELKMHTGLGLQIVKLLVDRYNGTILITDRIKGDYKKGSKFIITFPTI